MKENLYVLFLFLISVSVVKSQVSPVTADANSVILDHFNNAITGESRGNPLTYASGRSGLSNAVDFTGGVSYIMYTESTNLSARGTVELWVRLSSYNKGLVNVNWYNSTSYPSSGHVFHLRIDESGKVSLSGWGNPSNSFLGNSQIPLNTWTHLAVSWGDSTKIYINGKTDLVSALLFRPAIYASRNYIYLPYWGEGCGYIDEFHVSSLQRTNAEIASRVIENTPPPPTETIFHQAVLTNGGTLTGSNGSSTFSLGQTVYIQFRSASGILSEGLQQPVELYFTGFDTSQAFEESLLYPNPVDNYIVLKINGESLRQTVFYELLDLNGKSLKKNQVVNPETLIDLRQLPASCYLLKISDKNNQYKIYKITKK